MGKAAKKKPDTGWRGSFAVVWAPTRRRWLLLYSPEQDLDTASVVGHYESFDEADRMLKSKDGRDRRRTRARRDPGDSPVPKAMRAIRLLHNHGMSWEQAARTFMRKHPKMAFDVMDRVGSYPSSDVELRALQRVWSSGRDASKSRSARDYSHHRQPYRAATHTYASPEVKRTASYKRAERLENELAPKLWKTPGLTRANLERVADAWERAGFLGWADNYRAHARSSGRDTSRRTRRTWRRR